jgi:hypothetical protein
VTRIPTDEFTVRIECRVYLVKSRCALKG